MNIIQTLTKSLKNIFYNGIIYLLPIMISIGILSLCFNLVAGWIEPIKKIHIPYISHIPFYELMLSIIFITIIGFFIKLFIAKPLIKLIEKLFLKVPLISIIYAGTKQILHAFTAQDQSSFDKIVIIQFPIEGAYSFGFVTGDTPTAYAAKDGKKYVNVYIPTTPNPTSGFFVMVPEHEYMLTNLTRQEAIALIISGGILQPERYVKHKETVQETKGTQS